MRRGTCLCGAPLRWERYSPSGVHAELSDAPRRREVLPSMLPFDRWPVLSPQREWATANYALLLGGGARLIDVDHPLDAAIESAHNIHYATCPIRVTADELAAWSRKAVVA